MENLLSAEEVAGILGVKTTTLAIWRSTGRVSLPYLKIGGVVRYRREDIQEFLNTCLKKQDTPLDTSNQA